MSGLKQNYVENSCLRRLNSQDGSWLKLETTMEIDSPAVHSK